MKRACWICLLAAVPILGLTSCGGPEASPHGTYETPLETPFPPEPSGTYPTTTPEGLRENPAEPQAERTRDYLDPEHR